MVGGVPFEQPRYHSKPRGSFIKDGKNNLKIKFNGKLSDRLGHEQND
jgi:hypothetical protein